MNIEKKQLKVYQNNWLIKLLTLILLMFLNKNVYAVNQPVNQGITPPLTVVESTSAGYTFNLNQIRTGNINTFQQRSVSLLGLTANFTAQFPINIKSGFIIRIGGGEDFCRASSCYNLKARLRNEDGIELITTGHTVYGGAGGTYNGTYFEINFPEGINKAHYYEGFTTLAGYALNNNWTLEILNANSLDNPTTLYALTRTNNYTINSITIRQTTELIPEIEINTDNIQDFFGFTGETPGGLLINIDNRLKYKYYFNSDIFPNEIIGFGNYNERIESWIENGNKYSQVIIRGIEGPKIPWQFENVYEWTNSKIIFNGYEQSSTLGFSLNFIDLLNYNNPGIGRNDYILSNGIQFKKLEAFDGDELIHDYRVIRNTVNNVDKFYLYDLITGQSQLIDTEGKTVIFLDKITENWIDDWKNKLNNDNDTLLDKIIYFLDTAWSRIKIFFSKIFDLFDLFKGFPDTLRYLFEGLLLVIFIICIKRFIL